MTDNQTIEEAAGEIYERHFQSHYGWAWGEVVADKGVTSDDKGTVYDICLSLAAERMGMQVEA